MRWPERNRPSEPAPDLARTWREAERQLEWAETYLAAVDGIDLHDAALALETRRLRAGVAELRRQLSRPRVL